jgi:hypothetical protein
VKVRKKTIGMISGVRRNIPSNENPEYISVSRDSLPLDQLPN